LLEGSAAAAIISGLRRGDVVDALALGVAAGGVELPVEVLLRVAGHLRRRPRPHREPRDVAPVPAPVLLQPLKKQPAHATKRRKRRHEFHIVTGERKKKQGGDVWLASGAHAPAGAWRNCLASPLAKPMREGVETLPTREASRLTLDQFNGNWKVPVLFLAPRYPGAPALAAWAVGAGAAGGAALLAAAAAGGAVVVVVPGGGHIDRAALDEVDVGDERLVVLPGLARRAAGELRRDERPPVGRVLGPHHQRALEHLVLRLAPRPRRRRRRPRRADAVLLVVVVEIHGAGSIAALSCVRCALVVDGRMGGRRRMPLVFVPRGNGIYKDSGWGEPVHGTWGGNRRINPAAAGGRMG
jgi:hypothetical protein